MNMSSPSLFLVSHLENIYEFLVSSREVVYNFRYMKIVLDKVTWYSKLAAVILFALVFALGFWLGTQKSEKVYIYVPFGVHHDLGAK